MRRPLLLVLALVGCWSASKRASEPRPVEPAASTGGNTYGGDAYGGETYASLTGIAGVDAGLVDPTAGGNRVGPAPVVTIGTPSATNALEPAVIRRFVHQNLPKIRYCYEKELLADPSLAGRVVVQFTIGGNGTVVSATGSGMPGVDACVASVIRAIAFPAPTGGGAVNVSYPFVFRAGS